MNTLFLLRSRAGKMALSLCAAGTFAAALLTGCDQNFNLPDPNSPSPATAGVQTLVTGTLANWRYTEVNEFLGTAGRESYTSAADDPRILNEPISDGIDPTAFVARRPWTNMYFTIANARNLVDKASTLPAAQKAGLEGVAKTIWAHEIIRLSNIWFENGVKLKYSFEPSIEFATRAQGLAEASRLLDEANTALGAAGASFSFNLGTGFTGYDTPAQFAKVNRGIRARAAAYAGDYAACLTALGASFLKESSAATDMATGVNHVYTTQPGDVPPGARGGQGGSPFYQNLAAPGARWWAHTLHVSDNVDNTVDTRILNKVAKPSNIKVPATMVGSSLTSSWVISLYPTNTTPVSIIRNEELLLLRAEARALGAAKDLAGATADLNMVRAAAGVPALKATLTDATALTQLLYERRYSLFFEGYRWIDLKRFNRLGDIKAEQAKDKVMQAGWPKIDLEIPQ